jgi:PAS domain S-box-containing protein
MFEPQQFIILIVDDNPKNLQVLGSTLKDAGYKIDFATSGKEALEWLDEKAFDLVLLDVMMPEMDGFEVCEIIRKKEHFSNLPVLFLTAQTDKDSIAKGFGLGAQDYITKPFDKGELLARVKTHLDLKRSKESLQKTNQWLEDKVAERTKELQYSEERLKILFESAPDAIYLHDLKGNFLDGNKAAEKLMGYQREEFVGKNFLKLKLVTNNQLNKVAKLLSKNVMSMPTGPDEFTLNRKDGSQVDVEIRTYPVKIRDRVQVLGIARDISERKEIHRKILNVVIETEEKERQRFAEDLHDGLGPLLSAAKLYIYSLGTMIDPDKKGDAPEKAIETIDEAIKSIREISNNISPHILKNFGLVSAIRSLTDKITNPLQMKVRLTARMDERVDSNIEINLFRIVEELVHNTVKYSKALQIKIRLELENGQLCLSYTDDGQGFDVEKAYKKQNGNGLKNIQNRTRSMNGDVQFSSKIGNGMTVRIEIPINTKASIK